MSRRKHAAPYAERHPEMQGHRTPETEAAEVRMRRIVEVCRREPLTEEQVLERFGLEAGQLRAVYRALAAAGVSLGKEKP